MDLPIAMGSDACNSSSSNRTRSFHPGPALAAAPYRASGFGPTAQMRSAATSAVRPRQGLLQQVRLMSTRLSPVRTCETEFAA
jgi:hypothetical protein